MKKIFYILFFVAILTLIFTGCSKKDNNEPIVGGDRDEHGCIGSAGYSWCEAKQKCLRTWEESCK